ncbi:MAG: hypothetical protein R3C53_08855 [Pirellulaceae bacterium]
MTYQLAIQKHSLADPAGNRIDDYQSPIMSVSTTAGTPRLFHNENHFDGDDADLNSNDDVAVAYDKRALRNGERATAENFSNSSDGITGIMLDLQNATGNISPSDFEFRTGNTDDTSSWRPLQFTPTLATHATSLGQRVSLAFPSGTITNTWLQVRVLANPNTGLQVDDVFYFGNLIGDTGNGNEAAVVDFADWQLVYAELFSQSSITSRTDFNRSGQTDFADLQLLFGNLFASIELIQPYEPSNLQGSPAGWWVKRFRLKKTLAPVTQANTS